MCSSLLPAKKLWEDNAFSHVSLSTGSPNVTITHDALDLTVQCTWSWDLMALAPCYWHLVTITGDLLKLVHLRTLSPLVLTSGDHQSMYSWQYTSYWNTFLFSICKRTGGYTAQFRLYHLLMYCHCQSPWAKNTATYSTQPTKPIESCASGMQATEPNKSEWHKIKILLKLSKTTCQHDIIDSLFHTIFAYMYAYR